jgi:hypothetical protein
MSFFRTNTGEDEKPTEENRDDTQPGGDHVLRFDAAMERAELDDPLRVKDDAPE